MPGVRSYPASISGTSGGCPAVAPGSSAAQRRGGCRLGRACRVPSEFFVVKRRTLVSYPAGESERPSMVWPSSASATPRPLATHRTVVQRGSACPRSMRASALTVTPTLCARSWPPWSGAQRPPATWPSTQPRPRTASSTDLTHPVKAPWPDRGSTRSERVGARTCAERRAALNSHRARGGSAARLRRAGSGKTRTLTTRVGALLSAANSAAADRLRDRQRRTIASRRSAGCSTSPWPAPRTVSYSRPRRSGCAPLPVDLRGSSSRRATDTARARSRRHARNTSR